MDQYIVADQRAAQCHRAGIESAVAVESGKKAAHVEAARTLIGDPMMRQLGAFFEDHFADRVGQ